ncbi:MAG: OmpA family protein [Verrucomicrobia bacterium]|nr:OmpA family protein [Verrucomicrobiota bacterium]
MGEVNVKEKKANPRRAKTPAGVWLIVALTLLFGLGGFGIAAFIAIRALRAGKGAGITEVQPARSPAVTTPVPNVTMVPSSPASATPPLQPRFTEFASPSPAAQEQRILAPGAPSPAGPVNTSRAAQASPDSKAPGTTPDSSPADSTSPEPMPAMAVAAELGITTAPDPSASPAPGGSNRTDPAGNSSPPDQAAAAPTGPDAHDNAPILLKKDPEEEQRVRQEVLVRIDLLKELTKAEKDHLYAQVERARGFTKLAIVPFSSGRIWPENNQVEHLLSYLRRPNFQTLFEDPTIVLVCAGYADRTGSEAQNLEISHRRAANMVHILQSQTKIRNLMRAVGMGGSDMFDKSDAAKNRVVEIWLVQP